MGKTAKVAILNLGEGSFAEGFPVTLQIGEAFAQPRLLCSGRLGAATDLLVAYEQWLLDYRHLGLPFRLEAIQSHPTQVSVGDCRESARALSNALNLWLSGAEFRLMREAWLTHLRPPEEIRLIIQTGNRQLQHLPWHLWDLLENYPNTVVLLSPPTYIGGVQKRSKQGKVNILAVLGDSTGIDIRADSQLLENLPGGQVHFLVEPSRQKLTETLREQPWQILFFAGHSGSQQAGQSRLSINPQDSLSVEELKYALRKAIANGLDLAIFNSCDGLDLAMNLADLQIPQVIVMGEPVPDPVAQVFLKSFLRAYTNGNSFYLAVHEARQQLQGLEDQLPCASWLPVICQNPAAAAPSWEARQGRGNWQVPLLLAFVVAAFTFGIRQTGILQPLELRAYDQLVRLEPKVGLDPRIVVVAANEEDLATYGYPLSDALITQVAQKLNRYQPRVIGLDIYRNPSANVPGNIVAVCRVGDANDIGIPPPKRPTFHGFSNVVVDGDGVLRRFLFAQTPDPQSRCSASSAFSLQLAFQYLALPAKTNREGQLQIGSAVFRPLESDFGGYRDLDARGHQILLDYRSASSPMQQISLSQLLKGDFKKDLFENRIVLIGVAANSIHDEFLTPFGQKMFGVDLQAQMTSQVLNTVLDHRPLRSVCPLWAEGSWILFWSVVGAFLAWQFRAPSTLMLSLLFSGVLLSGLCFTLFISSSWVPFVPPALALIAAAVAFGSYLRIQP